MRLPGVFAVLTCVIACGRADGSLDGDEPLALMPADARLTVDLAGSVTQAYTVAALVEGGAPVDVTDQCTLSLDGALGVVSDHVVTVTGRGGETTVRATCATGVATAHLVVDLTGRLVIGATTPADAPDRFAGASVGADPARTPRVEYPLDTAITPVNLPTLEAQWTAAGNDLFHLRLTAAHAAIDVYTSGPEAPLAQPEWPVIAAAAAGGDLTFTVEAMAQAAPGTKHVSAPVRLTVAKDAIDRSAVYYWASSQGAIMSQAFGSTAAPTSVRGQCTSCHALSRTGTRLGYSRCVNNDCAQLFVGFLRFDAGAGGWVDAVDANTSGIRGSYTTFAPVGNPYPTDDQALAMVTTNAGSLALYDPDTGAAVPSNLTAAAPPGPGARRAALMADWSADGATVVYASTPHPGQWIDLGDGAIAKLRYSHAGGVHSFSEPEFIVRGPLQLPGGAYTNFFFPSLSGDGAVVVFNGARAPWRSNPARAAGQRLFLADADGRWATDLAALNGGAGDADITWPRWAPGASDDYYWVAFSSERDYGHRVTATNTSPSCVGNGVTQCKQIWIGAIRKSTIAANPGADPSAPPMWLPGQSPAANNISPYWTAEPRVD